MTKPTEKDAHRDEAFVEEQPGPECACCGPGTPDPAHADRPKPDQPFVVETLATPAGEVPVVSSRLTWGDRLGAVKVRWNVGRMDYRVDPGLYAVGRPGRHSPVLVTANYKLSFDHLRSSLGGCFKTRSAGRSQDGVSKQPLEEQSAWILALQTEGVNVWCAAGKGTFGTDELVRRIESGRLAEVVDHREIILPQLGAAGVSRPLVSPRCGFEVTYGPIRARDIPAFLRAGNVATPRMRRKTFPFRERIAVIPVELISALKYGILLGVVFLLASGVGWAGGYWPNVALHGRMALGGLAGAVFAGAVLTPALLPWLPGPAFSVKGAVAGLAVSGAQSLWWLPAQAGVAHWLEAGSWILIGSALAGYLALNFTGASTYTSLSGVRKEIRCGLPALAAVAAAGLAAWIAARFF